MAPTAPGYATAELSPKNWADFEKLLGKPGEWGGCWCMYYHRPRPIPKEERERLTRKQLIERNRLDHLKLVRGGRAHGIIVYASGGPVGWCQYGPMEELPRIDAGRRYCKLSLGDGGERLWRISCFCVDRKHRNHGVASVGLKAALDAIEKGGGGVVEAYPTTYRGAPVRGYGPALWFGTVSMFEREGFRTVAPFGKSNVLMRRTVRGGFTK